MADIIELIMAGHRRIRRLAGGLRDTVRLDVGTGMNQALGGTWDHLAGLIEAHLAAEEEICWLPMSGTGPQAAAHIRAVAAARGDVHEAITEARLHPAGPAPWWLAVSDTLRGILAQAGREEHDILPGFARRT